MSVAFIAAGAGPAMAGVALDAMASYLKQLPQAELITTHEFADGMYMRKVFRKAGVVIIGKVHKREHFYIVLQGRVRVGMNEYVAGDVVVSKPGTRRAVFAMEDSLCATVHRLEDPHCRDLEAIERTVVEPCETALFDASNNLKVLK